MSSKYEPEFKHKIVKLHLEEGKKENLFLKKAAAFFAKEIG